METICGSPRRFNWCHICVLCYIQVQIIQLDEDRGEFVLKATFDHPYPTTKIMWIPDQAILIIHVHKNYSKNFPPYVSTWKQHDYEKVYTCICLCNKVISQSCDLKWIGSKFYQFCWHSSLVLKVTSYAQNSVSKMWKSLYSRSWYQNWVNR